LNAFLLAFLLADVDDFRSGPDQRQDLG